LVLATHNESKITEFRTFLAPYEIQTLTLKELNIPEPEETGTTFAENAALKAVGAAYATGHVAISDDSGLCVHDLDGAPGIFSARWAGSQKDFRAAAERICSELNIRGFHDLSQCRAHFVSALVLAWPNGKQALFEGRVWGRLTWPLRGDKGFGYDPLFIPDGSERTFGEMTLIEKHGVPLGTGTSHRAKAFQALAQAYLGAFSEGKICNG
jgi:XTP/dITP diphosphohydrolase